MFHNNLIKGYIDTGFEEVENQFILNFKKRGEIGAACTVYHEGKKVVDLWGGYSNKKEHKFWEENTLVLVFSTTKGIAAMVVGLAHSKGFFDLDIPVSFYWPEFAEHGKEKITVRQLLSHQAGLPVLNRQVGIEELSDPDKMAVILASQKPIWDPGTKHGYHGLTLGWYIGEFIRRVDPKNRTLGQFFQDEIAAPLQLEFYIGTPDNLPELRIAKIYDFHPFQLLFHLNKMPLPFVRSLMKSGSLTARTFGTPKIHRPSDFALKEFRSVEIPSANGIGLVRSIAKLYGEFACGGPNLDLTQGTLYELEKPANPPTNGNFDEVLKVNTAFALGFMKPFSEFYFGRNGKSYGSPGFGGSFGFADPEKSIGFAYAPNKCGYYLWNDPREKALRDAVYKCIK